MLLSMGTYTPKSIRTVGTMALINQLMMIDLLVLFAARCSVLGALVISIQGQ